MNAPAPGTHMQWDDVIAFRTVAATLNLTAAAQHLGFSRAVISRRLQRLERTVGAVLLRRSTHGVTLTDAGHRLLRNVDAIGDLWEEAIADLTGTAALTDRCNARPPLRLAAHTATVRLLSALAASSPDLAWQTEPFDETKSLDVLASGDLDVVVGYHIATAPGFEAHDRSSPGTAAASPARDTGTVIMLEVVTEPIWLAVPSYHRYARASSIDLTDLRDDDWVTSTSPGLHQLLLDVCARRGFTPRIRHRSSNAAVIQKLLHSTDVIALASPVAQPTGDVIIIPLDDPPGRTIYLAWRSNALPPRADLPGALIGAVVRWYAGLVTENHRYHKYVRTHPQLFLNLLPYLS